MGLEPEREAVRKRDKEAGGVEAIKGESQRHMDEGAEGGLEAEGQEMQYGRAGEALRERQGKRQGVCGSAWSRVRGRETGGDRQKMVVGMEE